MREFAEYESLSDHLEATVERLDNALFGEGAFVRGLMVRDGDQAIGYALFYPSFSSFRAERGLYLEDLYIRESHRQQGLGRRVLKHIAGIALTMGFERLDLLVLDWNTPAVDFYKSLGAETNTDERHFKFVDEAFRSLAGC
jgi:GNAT superfamily N-acetyltransferase